MQAGQAQSDMSGTVVEPESASPPKRASRRWQDFVLGPLGHANAETRAYLASAAARGADGKIITVLVATALCLTVQRFFAVQEALHHLEGFLHTIGLDGLAAALQETMWQTEAAQLHRLTWWVAVCLLTYVVVPLLIIRCIFRERPRDYGLKLQGAFADSWVYGVMLAVAWPLIFLVSASVRFQETYPFYRLGPGADLWPNFYLWEVLYYLQFFGVEFFFRGFLLHGTRHRFGAYAIVVMMVPYCMLHFQKPLLECLASIIGAFVLGFMSLRTRSIWLGTAIHVTVAGSMDLASLWRQGVIP
jgi:membrane protease YdiL (CAAX protease family)